MHGVKKQRTFNTYLLEASDAATLATRLADIFGDRKGRFTIRSKNRFFSNKISDVLEVNRTALPGFSFDKKTLRTRTFNILEIDKGLDSTTMVLDDQRGIEENSGDF